MRLEDSVDQHRIKLAYDYKGAAPSVLVADVTSLDELGDISRWGSGCKESNGDKRSLLNQSRSENSRGEQSKLTAPPMSVVQHTAVLLHTAPLTLNAPAPLALGGAAIATATLAATTVVIMKNCMLMRRSWLRLGIEF
jgi:hypothetical protein